MAVQLADLGLRIGSELMVVRGGGRGHAPVEVMAHGIQLSLGHGQAGRILVMPLSGGEDFPPGLPTLADARIGDRVRVVRLKGKGVIRQRLMDMGIIRGVELVVERYAPLRDPLQLTVKGYSLALRVAEAIDIEIEWLEVGRSKPTASDQPPAASPHPGSRGG